MKEEHIVALLAVGVIGFTGYYDWIILLHYPRAYLFDPREFVDLCIHLFSIGALVQYLASGCRSTRLLRIYFYYEIVFFMVEVLIIFACFGIQELMFRSHSFHAFGVLDRLCIGAFCRLPVAMAVVYGLVVTGRKRTASLVQEEQSFVFYPVSRWERLGVRCVDMGILFIVIFLWYPLIHTLLLFHSLFSTIGTLATPFLQLAFSIVAFLYYLLLEGCLGISIGKIVTNTLIVNESGEKPTRRQLFGRGFARLIPFDGFSFLFMDRGWHDRVTGTYVVRGRYK